MNKTPPRAIYLVVCNDSGNMGAGFTTVRREAESSRAWLDRGNCDLPRHRHTVVRYVRDDEEKP